MVTTQDVLLVVGAQEAEGDSRGAQEGSVCALKDALTVRQRSRAHQGEKDEPWSWGWEQKQSPALTFITVSRQVCHSSGC